MPSQSDPKTTSTNVKVYSSFYNEMPYIKLAVSQIPQVGSIIDSLLSLPGQKFAEERVTYMFDRLKEEMEQVQDAVMNNRFIDTEEGYDLIFKAVSNAARTRQKDKLGLFAKILRGAYTKELKQHHPELYLTIVDELTVAELNILTRLHQMKQDWATNPPDDRYSGKMLSDSQWLEKHYPEYSSAEIQFSLSRVARTGLIKEQTGSYMGLAEGVYKVTQLYLDFVSFISKAEI